MNKIYKVMYSKVKQCAVVVSEIAKSHGHNEGRSAVRKHTALTAAVLVALGMFSFLGMPTAQADGDLQRNDFVAANDNYWYWDAKANNGNGEWEKEKYSDLLIGHRDSKDTSNYKGAGAKGPGAITAGVYAQAGEQTVTIGNRNAGASKGSVFVGEHSGYNNGTGNDALGDTNNYVTSVGFESDATGWGSIAIGSNATAANSIENTNVVDHEGNENTTNNKDDDVYGIKKNPSITGASVALGYSAKAEDGNIAIGAYSEAKADTSSTTPYVSVGNSNLKRRITNVADGDAATDVATVGQMNKAIEAAGVTGWTLSTNGNTSGTTIKSGTKVDFSPAVDGKNGTADHSNVAVSNTGSNVKIGLNKDIILGEAAKDKGGSLNVYSDSSDSNNISNHVKITGSTISVNYKNKAGSDTRGVILGVGEEDSKPDGYIAFNNVEGGYTYLHASTDASEDKKGRLEYVGNDRNKKYIANLDDGITLKTDSIKGHIGSDSIPMKLNQTYTFSGDFGEGKTTDDLSNGNIAVVAQHSIKMPVGGGAATVTDDGFTVKLAKDLKGITSIGNQTTKKDGNKKVTTGAKIVLSDNGTTTISGGNVNVSGNKVTGLADGTEKTDAVTVQQLNEVQTYTTEGLAGKANVDASNIGANLKGSNGISAADADQITTNENAWGTALGTGSITNQNGQLVTGGTVYNALQQQKNELTNALNAGWGINIDKTTTGNTFSLNRNLGTNIGNTNKGTGKVTFEAKGTNSLILGGQADTFDRNNVKAGTDGQYSVLVGGRNNYIDSKGTSAVIAGGFRNSASGVESAVFGGGGNTASGSDSVILGGSFNKASGEYSTVIGGGNKFDYQEGNCAEGTNSTIIGGRQNDTWSESENSVIVGGHVNNTIYSDSVIVGGGYNVTYTNNANVFGGYGNWAGDNTTISGGVENITLAYQAYSLSGYANQVAGYSATSLGGKNQKVIGDYSTAIGGASTAKTAENATAIGTQAVVTAKNGLALGYKATADKEGTISFGHDKGDVSGYNSKIKLESGSYSLSDIQKYLVGPYSGEDTRDVVYTPTYYESAEYNRLVKVADGEDAHDTVVMEQLKPYTKSDASNIGAHLKTYTVGEDGETITEADATPEKQKENKDAWGQALGAGTFTTGTSDKATDASTSDQLVTGSTLYDYDKPTGTQNYVKDTNTTGQNLSALDAQVKANADALTKPNHNIKYYSVTAGPSLGYDQYTNENNDGTKGTASLAAGNVTHTDGAASTVVGSYSAVFGTGLQGAAALSYGTVNVNNNTDTTKKFSGVANSIVGQANMTTNSNAAIIYGAGNTVTNSYRDIDEKKAEAIFNSAGNAEQLQKALQDAVSTSGGQVMVMGGGNKVDSAYMTQVTGVGNTVKGNQVQNADGKWVTDESAASIKDYDEKKSSHYNYVDGFNNDVINGKHDYIIGANNTLTGDSYDDDSVKPIKKSNQSNIVIGDNHTLDRKKNTVIIGSSDTANTVTNGSDAVIIGHNANAASDNGADNAVAIGRSAKATGGNAVTIGVNTSAGENSITIGSESSAISGSNIAIGRYARVYGDNVTNAVALGENTKALVSDGVAIGSQSQATVKGNSVEGYDPATGNDSEDTTATWKATKGAVSIGTADGKVTRQINGLAAGTKDTDAVNVAQLKKLGDNTVQYDLNTNKGKITLAGQNGTTITNVKSALDGAKDAEGKDATIATATGDALKNAANLGDLQKVYKEVNEKADKASASHTALTVEGGTSAGTKDEKTKEDVYAGKNILLHESTDENGKVTYDLKLAKDINIGTPGKDGEDGKIGIDGRDGHIGLNGSDGITVRGLDGENGAPGKDGVTITGPKGADGIDGKVGISGTDGKDAVSISGKDGVGHIGLTGPAGTNGKDGTNAVDITVKNGYDGANGINGKNGVDGTSLTRIVYTDNTGEHQVATMEDGLKFKGDDTTVIAKKLNNTMEIIGGANSENLTDGNIGVNSTDKGQLKVQLAKDLKGITSISNQTTTKDGDKDVTTGATIILGTDGTTTITGGDVNVGGNKVTNIKSALDGAKDADGNTVTIATATGDVLKNAVNLGDLKKVYNDVNSKASAAHTALTVEGGKVAGTADGVYTGDNILLHATTDATTGKVTYDLKLNNDIMIGNKGKDGVSITGPQGEAGKDGIDGKVGISGKDGKDAVSISGKDGVGHIGLTGPAGTNGKDGADGTPGKSIDITVKNGYNTAGQDGKDGINGENGVDGTSLTRVVYTDQTGEHQVATMEDGLKFKGDDETVIAKKLNNQLDIIGGAAGTLTDGNIGVKSTTDGKLKVQLAQDLTKITSISNQTTTGAGDQAKTTGARIDLGSDGTTTISGGDVNVSGNKITHVGSGIEAEKDGKYAVTDANKSNAANIGDVDHMVNQAVGKLSNDTKVDLARKANVDASNLTADDVTKWQEKLGNGEVKSDNTGLVTGDTVFKAVDIKANRDGSNLTDTEADSFSEKIARGEVKDGENRAVSGDAVNKAISKVTGDVNTKLDGKANTSLDNITDGGRDVIRDLAKGSIGMENGNHTTVSSREVDGVKTFKVDVTADGKVESGNSGPISGGTAFTELRPADGTYVKQANTTAANLTALDKGLKTTSDLIHTNGDTIQIGGNSTATKIDVSGKDNDSNTTGRVVTGVVTDVQDASSAANVGYVNGVTAANTQQIYRDMNNAYGRLNNNINKAAAGSNALAALHPLDYDPDDKADFAVGYGHYRNANAAAVGAFYHPNENTMVNVGVSLGNGDPGFNAGVSFKIGSGSAGREAMSKTEMAKVINSQSKEIDALKKDNADKDKRIDALEQKMAEILAKLDKNGK